MTDDERLVFSNFIFNSFPDGRCRAQVELTRMGGGMFVGTREGKGAETVALRCAAEATVDAIQQVVESGRSFELLGVKSVHAFDSVIVIVSVGVTDQDGRRRFVGTYVADHGAERAAAVAVLNATNRYVASDAVMRS
jgi:hypothetical protein